MSLMVVAIILGTLILGFYLAHLYVYGDRPVTTTTPVQRTLALTEQARARAEALLQASVTPEEYASLEENGYLEVSSRLFANRVYQIPRKRRRVRVYVVDTHDATKRQKLGELCLIACEPVPDADLVLTHKWLLEADEETYLSTANWISGSWYGGLPV
ncbi:MAG TPA: hypothetical protein P5121_31665 [Caldilineaceae bacterium]|nr:hypothetical protein [Caldilineaceae bacterium]